MYDEIGRDTLINKKELRRKHLKHVHIKKEMPTGQHNGNALLPFLGDQHGRIPLLRAGTVILTAWRANKRN